LQFFVAVYVTSFGQFGRVFGSGLASLRGEIANAQVVIKPSVFRLFGNIVIYSYKFKKSKICNITGYS
jgi:hypothetical protein